MNCTETNSERSVEKINMLQLFMRFWGLPDISLVNILFIKIIDVVDPWEA